MFGQAVMPIGGLHHGRLGNPVIDMTSSGYIGEPQVHFRNPNLTWYANYLYIYEKFLSQVAVPSFPSMHEL